MLHDRTVAGGRRVKKLFFPSTVGDLEGVLFCRVDEEPAAVAVFCHPHPQFGGTMHNRATYRASDALFRLGLAVLRFNFRGVGRSAGVWTGGEGEEEDAEGAISFLLERYPGRPVLLAGFSFGAGVALTVGARDERVRAMLALAPSPGRRDFGFLGRSTKPKGVIQGTDDELCPLTRSARCLSRLGATQDHAPHLGCQASVRGAHRGVAERGHGYLSRGSLSGSPRRQRSHVVKLGAFRVGLVQTQPRFGEVEANIDRALRSAQRALGTSGGADLVILPELFNTGYLFRSHREARTLAEDARGGYTAERLTGFAREHRTTVVAGICECHRGEVYNSAIWVGPGGVGGVYRKVHLFDREKLFFRPGRKPWPVFRIGDRTDRSSHLLRLAFSGGGPLAGAGGRRSSGPPIEPGAAPMPGGHAHPLARVARLLGHGQPRR